MTENTKVLSALNPFHASVYPKIDIHVGTLCLNLNTAGRHHLSFAVQYLRGQYQNPSHTEQVPTAVVSPCTRQHKPLAPLAGIKEDVAHRRQSKNLCVFKGTGSRGPQRSVNTFVQPSNLLCLFTEICWSLDEVILEQYWRVLIGGLKEHCKKELAVFPSPAGMSLIKLFLGGNNLVFSRPERVWSVTSRLGTGKWLTLFYSEVSNNYYLSNMFSP